MCLVHTSAWEEKLKPELLAAVAAVCLSSAEGFQAPLESGSISMRGSLTWHRVYDLGPVHSMIPRGFQFFAIPCETRWSVFGVFESPQHEQALTCSKTSLAHHFRGLYMSVWVRGSITLLVPKITERNFFRSGKTSAHLSPLLLPRLSSE